MKISLIDNFLAENKTRYVIYLLRNNINNKIYIGQSINIKSRLSSYGKPKKNPIQVIEKSIKKYGWNNFQCEIIYYAISIDELNEKECYYIKTYNSTNRNIGYNIRPGGNNSEMSETTKEKLRLINLNKKVSDETIQKIKESTIGMNNHFYGKNHTQETKLKMIESWKNRKDISDETKRKMSQSQKGRTHTNKSKEKMSSSHLGIRSHETPVFILNNNLEIIQQFKNIEECSLYINCSKRNVYDSITNIRFVKRKYWIIKQDNYDMNISKIKSKIS